MKPMARIWLYGVSASLLAIPEKTRTKDKTMMVLTPAMVAMWAVSCRLVDAVGEGDTLIYDRESRRYATRLVARKALARFGNGE